MPRTISVQVFLFALTLLFGWPSPAYAAPAVNEDAQVSAELDKIIASDVADANFGQARRRLHTLLDRCKKRSNSCTPKTVASIHTMLGVMSAQAGQKDQAMASFGEALELDKDVQIPPTAEVTEATKRIFAEAHVDYEAAHARPDDSYRVVWTSRVARAAYVEALAAQKSGDFDKCVDRLRAALKEEDQAGARLRLAECLDGAGHLIDALREIRNAVDAAAVKRDMAIVKAGGERVESISKRLGRITFVTPQNMPDLRVLFDDRLVPKDRLSAPVVVDPGPHKVRAEGTIAGTIVIDQQQVMVPQGGAVTVKLAPRATAMTQGQLECMLAAKGEAELAQCLAEKRTPLNIRAVAEFSAYADTQRVEVATPSFLLNITSPTQGWNVGGTFIVDVVSAASADVVSEASRRFNDTRYAGTLFGGYKYQKFHFRANGNASSEHDYFSRGIGGRVAVDLLDGQFTPELGYGYALDTIGRTDVPFDVFSNELTTQSIVASGTVLLSPKSLLVVGGNIGIERGDQSKPYRYVPLFDQGTPVPNHASIDYVNSVRLPERPLEQLPLERDRFSLSGRYINRIRANGTLRVEERLYTDNWGLKASTTDARYLMDLTAAIRLFGSLRLHAQTGASFYDRAYFVNGFANGVVLLPVVRTTDKELGPLLTPTLGAGARFALTAPDAKVQLGITVQGSLMYTRYLDALFTGSRTAIFGTTGFEVETQ